MSVPTFYGKELRWKREAAGLSLEDLVRGSFFGKTYLSDIERGERRMPLELARHADQVLSTDGYFERNCEDVRKARRGTHAEYFADVLASEQRAMEIEEWGPCLLPGPLQLEPYIRAVVLAAHPSTSDDLLAAKVADRRSRAGLVEESDGPETWMVLHESILHEPVLPAGDMAEQLAHVAALARQRRLIPQILLRNAGPHPFMMGTARFMTFPDEPPLMYTEGMYSGQLIDDPVLVRQYSKAYDRLRATALAPEASIRLIEAAAEDYRNGKHPERFEPPNVA
ncbi:helix-turn-helix domain-containing protein [Streptomyces sp. NPDC059639]|uniref:helix-turn-helix domain-containing protein n=1 Tax=Streptomyces sp. NPDC059639 TaxID=3346891 RepID=UPI003691F766